LLSFAGFTTHKPKFHYLRRHGQPIALRIKSGLILRRAIMTDPTQIAETYLAVWNTDDRAARLELLAHGWAAEATYVDPMMAGQGPDGIADMIEGARAQFPGHDFSLAGITDGHGDYVRFSWTLAPTGGQPVAGGSDVVRLDRDGRIAQVIGFLDGAGR
jgi:SnoaL-like domain